MFLFVKIKWKCLLFCPCWLHWSQHNNNITGNLKLGLDLNIERLHHIALNIGHLICTIVTCAGSMYKDACSAPGPHNNILTKSVEDAIQGMDLMRYLSGIQVILLQAII